MRINEVLEGINKAIDNIREEQGLKVNGHLTSVTTVKKSMGPYRQCYIMVVYVNSDNNTTTELFTKTIMDRVMGDKVDALIAKTESLVVTAVVLYMYKHLESLIKGNYGSE